VNPDSLITAALNDPIGNIEGIILAVATLITAVSGLIAAWQTYRNREEVQPTSDHEIPSDLNNTNGIS